MFWNFWVCLHVCMLTSWIKYLIHFIFLNLQMIIIQRINSLEMWLNTCFTQVKTNYFLLSMYSMDKLKYFKLLTRIYKKLRRWDIILACCRMLYSIWIEFYIWKRFWNWSALFVLELALGFLEVKKHVQSCTAKKTSIGDTTNQVLKKPRLSQ